MQLFKTRDFGSLISDTFNFFKVYGRNYFRHYLTLNGILLILLVVLYVVGYRSIFSQIFSSNLEGNSHYFEEYFQQNTGVLVGLGLVFMLLFFLTMFVVYLYPVFYMKRIAETGAREVTLNEISSDLKANVGKFFIFLLVMMFVVTPLIFVLMGISGFLMIIIIGFFLLLLMMPVIINAINFTLFDYFSTDRGIFSSISYGIRSQFSYPSGNMRSPFWKYWGSTATIFFIVQTISGIIMMVPAFMMMGSIFTAPQSEQPQAMGKFFESSMGILYFVCYGISLLVSFILMNVIYVNAGLMYYDSRTDLHRQEHFSEIDTIGTREV